MTEFPSLFYLNHHNELYIWRVWADGPYLKTEWGRCDIENGKLILGKQQTSEKLCEAKNIGRSNATTPEEQAIAEAKALREVKLNHKYRATPEAAQADKQFLPMLASTWESRFGKKVNGITFPCDIQPKLDGLRCLAIMEEGEVILYSRTGQIYNVPHISKYLKEFQDQEVILDGELYIHGVSLQDLNSYVKNTNAENALVEYHIYDIFYKEAPEARWPDRLKYLKELELSFNHFNDINNQIYLMCIHPKTYVSITKLKESQIHLPLCFVQTQIAHSQADIQQIHDQYVEQGYEGAIVRCYDNSPYTPGSRSPRLIKFKAFEDAEYKVTGWVAGVGKFSKVPIWLCETEDGTMFEVTMKGSMAEREASMLIADKQIGKYLTVRYWGKTDKNIPKFAQGICFRIPEDLPQ